MKPCSVCAVVKPLAAFDSRSGTKDGHRSQCKQCRKEVEYANRRPMSRFANSLRSGYGMTVADYRGLFDAQGGQCAVCRTSLTRPAIDHDHKTGRVRGLVCFRCNTSLAAIENADFMRDATRYLHEHATTPPAHEFYKNSRHFDQLRTNKAKANTKRRATPKMVAIHDRIRELLH